MEHVLEKLFESVPKIRILRLFMQNPEKEFELSDIVKQSGIRRPTAHSELRKFLKLGLLEKRRTTFKEELVRKRKGSKKSPKIIMKIRKADMFYVEPTFPLINELHDLLVKSAFASRKKLLRQVKGLGRIKLAILSGIFIQDAHSRTDLLVVGDNVKKSKLEHFLTQIESELGRSLQYTIMDNAEFKYRMDMYDRFLRDILERPHEKLVNKVGL